MRKPPSFTRHSDGQITINETEWPPEITVSAELLATAKTGWLRLEGGRLLLTVDNGRAEYKRSEVQDNWTSDVRFDLLVGVVAQ
jgi:hypothetical protein